MYPRQDLLKNFDQIVDTVVVLESLVPASAGRASVVALGSAVILNLKKFKPFTILFFSLKKLILLIDPKDSYLQRNSLKN